MVPMVNSNNKTASRKNKLKYSTCAFLGVNFATYDICCETNIIHPNTLKKKTDASSGFSSLPSIKLQILQLQPLPKKAHPPVTPPSKNHHHHHLLTSHVFIFQNYQGLETAGPRKSQRSLHPRRNVSPGPRMEIEKVDLLNGNLAGYIFRSQNSEETPPNQAITSYLNI